MICTFDFLYGHVGLMHNLRGILGESKGIKTRLYNLSKHDNNNEDVYFFKKGNLFLVYLNILFMHLKIYDSKKKQNI